MLMNYFRSLLAQLVGDEKGQTAIEYALVIALISIVVCGAVATLFGATGPVLTAVSNTITTAL
jgi:Flp pilus assembly pilin Flp